MEACDPDKLPPGTNYSVICQPDNRLVEVNNRTVELTLCLQNSDKSRGNPCTDCLNAYNKLADHYGQLRSAPNGVCFEAVDQVNCNSKY